MAGKAVMISRDPFARVELFRRVEESGTCYWCGNTNAHGKVFRYGYESDGMTRGITWDRQVYCSRNCRRTSCDEE